MKPVVNHLRVFGFCFMHMS